MVALRFPLELMAAFRQSFFKSDPDIFSVIVAKVAKGKSGSTFALMSQVVNNITVQPLSGRISRVQNNGNDVGAVQRSAGRYIIELVEGLGTVEAGAEASGGLTVYWGEVEQPELASALTELVKAERNPFILDGVEYNWVVEGSMVKMSQTADGVQVATITRGQGFTSAVDNDDGMVHWTCVVVAAVLEASGWEELHSPRRQRRDQRPAELLIQLRVASITGNVSPGNGDQRPPEAPLHTTSAMENPAMLGDDELTLTTGEENIFRLPSTTTGARGQVADHDLAAPNKISTVLAFQAHLERRLAVDASGFPAPNERYWIWSVAIEETYEQTRMDTPINKVDDLNWRNVGPNRFTTTVVPKGMSDRIGKRRRGWSEDMEVEEKKAVTNSGPYDQIVAKPPPSLDPGLGAEIFDIVLRILAQ
ncbi:hypothetical protein C8J56DRAFT_879687 [Mycena floridula]|nr:hypothetical protein C8J56DRAFT_879687 [Mycena floridula]